MRGCIAVCVGCVVAGGQVASAQTISASVTVHWKNTATGVATSIGPGESAAIWVDVEFSPPVGTPVETPHGAGTVAGLASIFFNLHGSGAPAGSWRTSGPGFNGTPEIDGPLTNTNWQSFGRRVDAAGGWAIGGAGAQGGGPMGWTIHDYVAAQAGQFPLSVPGNSFNPIREIMRMEWTPDDFTTRMITFQSASATHGGVWLLVELPGNIHTTINVPMANISWGAVQIPVPSPSGMLVLAGGGVLAARRRRRAFSIVGTRR